MSIYDYVRPGTVALWTFDGGNGIDSSSYHNDLTAVGSPTYTHGKFSKAIYLYGPVLRKTASSSSLRLYYAMSICAWIKTTATERGIVFSFIDSTSSTSGTGYAFGYYLNRIIFMVGNGMAWFATHTNLTINPLDGEWHWIVITRGTYTRIYIDGIIDLEEASNPVGFSWLEIPNIGSFYNPDTGGNTYLSVGSMDNLHILSYELSYAEIRRMYAFQMGRL